MAKGSNTRILDENMKKDLLSLIENKNSNTPSLEIPSKLKCLLIIFIKDDKPPQKIFLFNIFGYFIEIL
jgi:hypothetical protein